MFYLFALCKMNPLKELLRHDASFKLCLNLILKIIWLNCGPIELWLFFTNEHIYVALHCCYLLEVM